MLSHVEITLARSSNGDEPNIWEEAMRDYLSSGPDLDRSACANISQELEIDFEAVTVNLVVGEHLQPAFRGSIPLVKFGIGGMQPCVDRVRRHCPLLGEQVPGQANRCQPVPDSAPSSIVGCCSLRPSWGSHCGASPATRTFTQRPSDYRLMCRSAQARNSLAMAGAAGAHVGSPVRDWKQRDCR